MRLTMPGQKPTNIKKGALFDVQNIEVILDFVDEPRVYGIEVAREFGG